MSKYVLAEQPRHVVNEGAQVTAKANHVLASLDTDAPMVHQVRPGLAVIVPSARSADVMTHPSAKDYENMVVLAESFASATSRMDVEVYVPSLQNLGYTVCIEEDGRWWQATRQGGWIDAAVFHDLVIGVVDGRYRVLSGTDLQAIQADTPEPAFGGGTEIDPSYIPRVVRSAKKYLPYVRETGDPDVYHVKPLRSGNPGRIARVSKATGKWTCSGAGCKVAKTGACGHILAVQVFRQDLLIPEPGGNPHRSDVASPAIRKAAARAAPILFYRLVNRLVETIPLKDYCGKGRPEANRRRRYARAILDVALGKSLIDSNAEILANVYAQTEIGLETPDNARTYILNDPAARDILEDLVVISGSPVYGIEVWWGVDGTGFRVSHRGPYYEDMLSRGRYHELSPRAKDAVDGKDITEEEIESLKDDERELVKRVVKRRHRYCMGVFAIGQRTQIIGAAAAKMGAIGESRRFIPMFLKMLPVQIIKAFGGDRAYTSKGNAQLHDLFPDAEIYLDFKSNSKRPGPRAWRRAFDLVESKDEGYLSVYRSVRAQSESGNKRLKQKHGDLLASRNDVARENEVLVKAIVHNLHVLILEHFHRGIELDFRPGAAKLHAAPRVSIDRLEVPKKMWLKFRTAVQKWLKFA